MTRMNTTLYRDAQDRWGLAHGDAIALLDRLPARSIDVVITDPPYGIGFGGEKWDRPVTAGDGPAQAFERFTRTWATSCRRVLKPGGHLLAFGAPRTFHRLVAGIEDGGFDIRDTVLWLCGQGVPKGRRLPGGFSTTLKPGYEPIVLARAPIDATMVDTRRRWGTGVLAIGTDPPWPGNVVLSHGAGCRADRCAAGCPARMLNEARPVICPSRFFYAAKASRQEREAGCDKLQAQERQLFGAKRHRSTPMRNIHPTVKPIELMRWLVRLAAPPGGVVLDPFAGSGTTGIAATREDRGFLGIEREDDYVEIAIRRLAHWAAPETGD